MTEKHKLCAHGCVAGTLDDRCKALERRNRELLRANSLLHQQLLENAKAAAREVLAEMGPGAKP